MTTDKERSQLLKDYDKAVGSCPYCKSKRHWYNDVPLRAFCWGSENKSHREWRKIVPGKLNPYLKKG